MIDTIHLFIERYGLLAVFLGCVAEGESAAVFAGFFTHQHVFPVWGAFIATFAGAFVGDAMIFFAGRRFANHQRVRRLTRRPGFSHALDLAARRPVAYVMLNRYVYGFRAVGGVAAGLSSLSARKFLVLNALSSAVWAGLFLTVGYVFGAGAEQVVGGEMAKHQRLIVGIVICAAVAAVAALAARHVVRNTKESPRP